MEIIVCYGFFEKIIFSLYGEIKHIKLVSKISFHLGKTSCLKGYFLSSLEM